MSVIEAPPESPIDFEAWYRLGGDENHSPEYRPVGHLVGKCVLEERMDAAEERLLAGEPLTQTEHDLLILGDVYEYPGYDEYDR